MTPEQQAKADKAELEVETDLRKETKELLIDMQLSSKAAWPENKALTKTLVSFALFLAVLSRQSDAQARENLVMQDKVVRLTNQLYWITIALGFIAFAQIFLAYLQLKEAKISNRDYQHAQDAERGKSKDDVQSNKK